MKKQAKRLLAAVLTALMLCVSTVSASAADAGEVLQKAWQRANDSAVVLADHSLSLKIAGALFDGAVQPQKTLSELFADKHVTGVYLLSDTQTDKVSDRLADSAKIYLVELRDGRKTYYMAVDLRAEDAVYFSNLFVLRKTSRKLLARSQEMGGADVLMDYTHIIGELSLHYVGYRVTDALGGEELHGLLQKVYTSCTVADLNPDEYRMLVLIRIIGLLIG